MKKVTATVNVPSSGGYLLNQSFPAPIKAFGYNDGIDNYLVLFINALGLFTNNPEEGVECYYVHYGSTMGYTEDVDRIRAWERMPDDDETIVDFQDFANLNR